MNFVFAFICGGLICLIGQVLMDKFKLLPVHITIIFVFIGAILEFGNIYDKLVEFGSAGFLVPISSFGHSVAEAAVNGLKESGVVGIFSNILETTSFGISLTVFLAFLTSLIFKVRS